MHKFTQSITKDKYQIINCETCGYWHVYPMPSALELHDYYANKYYENLGNNRSMTDKVNDPDGFYKIKYEDRIRHIQELLLEGETHSLLDIGCGYGDFIDFIEERHKWFVTGVEPSASCRVILKEKRHRFYSSLLPLIEEGVKFPVITMFNVLEHLSNPDNMLNQTKKLLEPNGIVVILVPNDFSVLQRILNKGWYFLHPLDHLNYWNFETLEKYLYRMGFEIIHKTTGFPLETFELMGEHYIGNDAIGKKVHEKRVNFEKALIGNEQFKDELYSSFAKLGIGREIEVYCKLK